jgi:hypothetical protein
MRLGGGRGADFGVEAAVEGVARCEAEGSS